MVLGKIGDSATINRKLNYLRIASLVKVNFKGNDRRTKYLAPTNIANNYIQQMDDALINIISDRRSYHKQSDIVNTP
jgi:hypothetical protein